MRVLGLDFETTGLDCTKDQVIEIGAVVWDTDARKPVTIYSELIKPDNFIGLPQEIIKITGIEDQSLFDFGVTAKVAFTKLLSLIDKVEYIVAHNAPFDKGFLSSELKKLNLPEVKTPWICTKDDVPYGEDVNSRKLSYVASDHKILNPFAHRAIFDVLTMLQVLSCYNMDQVISRSQSPTLKVTALVSFDDKDKAKNLGFRWDAKNKTWVKDIKECDMESVQFPFQIRVESQEQSLF